MAAVPQTAGATPLPGENGRIVLTSYQNFGQARAELFLLPVPFSSGGGTLSPPIATSATERHRHPTWSPDRTHIAFEKDNGTPANRDIYVASAANGSGQTPVSNVAAGAIEGKPAW